MRDLLLDQLLYLDYSSQPFLSVGESQLVKELFALVEEGQNCTVVKQVTCDLISRAIYVELIRGVLLLLLVGKRVLSWKHSSCTLVLIEVGNALGFGFSQ